MLSIPGLPGRTCDGYSRRELLRVGGAGLIGLSLPEFLRMQAMAAPAKLAIEPKAKSVTKAKSARKPPTARTRRSG